MLEENGEQHYLSGTLLSVSPALVLGLGKFGREVCSQLVTRLHGTEAAYSEKGHTLRLLVRTDNKGEIITPSPIRVMHLDWEQWFDQECASSAFLTESIPLQGTSPQRREADRPPQEVQQMREGLRMMAPVLIEVFDSLDLYKRVSCPSLPGSHTALRIFVVCALRETDSASLMLDLLTLLQEACRVYSRPTQSIELFCYVGGTPLSEHLQAGGIEADYHESFSAELARILPQSVAKQQIPTLARWSENAKGQESFLDRLDRMCKSASPHTGSSVSCYLFDTRFADGLPTMRGQRNEPDEVVLAAALALHMLIVSNTSPCQTVQQDIAHQRHQHDSSSLLGPFTAFGVASSVLAMPTLYRFVSSQIAGDFMQKALLVTGDAAARQMQKKREDQLAAFEQSITFEAVRAGVAQQQDMLTEQEHEEALTSVLSFGTMRTHTYKTALDRLKLRLLQNGELATIEHHLQVQQGCYKQFIDEQWARHQCPLYEADQAPLMQVYHFLEESWSRLFQLSQSSAAPAITQAREPSSASSLERERQRYLDEVEEHFEAVQRSAHFLVSLLSAAQQAILVTLGLLIGVWVSWLLSASQIAFSWIVWSAAFIILLLFGYAYWHHLERFIQHSWHWLFAVIQRWQVRIAVRQGGKGQATPEVSAESHSEELPQPPSAQRGGRMPSTSIWQRAQIYREQVETTMTAIKRNAAFWFRLIGALGWAGLVILALVVALHVLAIPATMIVTAIISNPSTTLLGKLGSFVRLHLIALSLSFVILWLLTFVFRHKRDQRRLQQQCESMQQAYQSLLEVIDWEAYRQAVTQLIVERAVLVSQLKTLCGPDGWAETMQRRFSTEAEMLRMPQYRLESLHIDEQLIRDLKAISDTLIEKGSLWKQRGPFLRELIEMYQKPPGERDVLEQWLLERVEAIHHDEREAICGRIQVALKELTDTPQRVEEQWHRLFARAQPLLQYDNHVQDTQGMRAKLLAAHGLRDLHEYAVSGQQPDTHLLESADPLRWTCMSVHLGISLEGVKFSAMALGPLPTASERWLTVQEPAS